MRKLILSLAFAQNLFLVAVHADWGDIVLFEGNGYKQANISNSRLFIDYRYAHHTYLDGMPTSYWSLISDFVNRSIPDPDMGIVQVTQASWLDHNLTNGAVKNSSITKNTATQKTVRLELNCTTESMSIFKDSPAIKIEYEKTCGSIEDRVSPGGKVVVDVAYLGGASNTGIEYKDNVILGGFNKKNGQGIARIYPKSALASVNAVEHGWKANTTGAFTSWVFTTSGGGEEELTAMGKQILDGIIPSPPLPSTAVKAEFAKQVPMAFPKIQKLGQDFSVTVPFSGYTWIKVLTPNGQTVATRQGSQASYSLPGDLFRPGIYILTLRGEKSSAQTKFTVTP